MDLGPQLQVTLGKVGALKANGSWSLFPDLKDSNVSDVTSYKTLLPLDEQDLRSPSTLQLFEVPALYRFRLSQLLEDALHQLQIRSHFRPRGWTFERM